jgi:hypothetical protein
MQMLHGTSADDVSDWRANILAAVRDALTQDLQNVLNTLTTFTAHYPGNRDDLVKLHRAISDQVCSLVFLFYVDQKVRGQSFMCSKIVFPNFAENVLKVVGVQFAYLVLVYTLKYAFYF